jgi:hypothetical protein
MTTPTTYSSAPHISNGTPRIASEGNITPYSEMASLLDTAEYDTPLDEPDSYNEAYAREGAVLGASTAKSSYTVANAFTPTSHIQPYTFVQIKTGPGLTVKKGKIRCRSASDETFGCISPGDFENFSEKLSEDALEDSESLADIIGDGTGTGALVFGSGATMSALTLSGLTLTDVATSSLLATNASGAVVATSSITVQALNVLGISTTTFQNGVNLATGCFAVGGICVTGGGGGGSGVVSAGTTGQVPFYAADGTTLTATSSLFIASTGNVSIGTTTGYGLFTVRATSTAHAIGAFSSTGRGIRVGTGDFNNFNTAGTALTINLGAGTGNTYASLSVTTNGTASSGNLILQPTGGNIGIGTTSPYQTLSVSGSMALTGAFFDRNASAGTSGYVLQTTGTGVEWVATSSLGFGTGSGMVSAGTTGQVPFYAADGTTLTATSSLFISTSGNIGVGSTSPYAKFSITNSSNSQPSFLVEDAVSPDATPFVIDSNGRVGIGSSTPSAELVISSTNPSFLVDDTDVGGSQIEFVASGATTYIRSGESASDAAARFRVVRTGTTNTNVLNFDVYADTTYVNGVLGIGTTTPLSELHVHDTADSLITISGGDSNRRGIDFNLLSGTNAWSLGMDANEDFVVQNRRSDVDDFRIRNTAGTDLLLLESSTGNLSIGTSTLGGMLRVSDTGSATGALFVSSSQTTPGAGANLAMFQTYEPTWDRPLVRINDNSTSGAAASIRLDSPNPDIEFVETDQVAPSGKFEIAGSGNRFQINSRRLDETAFETILEFAQRSQTSVDALTVYMESTSATRNGIKIINATSSAGAQPGIAWRNEVGLVDTARISSQSGASNINAKLFFEVADSAKALQTRMVIDVNGNVGIGTTSPYQKLSVSGNMALTGALYDRNASAGTGGMVLQTTGTGVQWVATSSLGFGSSFSNSAELAALLGDETGTGNAVFSASPTFTGTVNGAAATLSSLLTLSGSAANIALGSNFLSGDGDDEGLFVGGSGNVGIGTSTPAWSLQVASATTPYLALTNMSGDVDAKHWLLSNTGDNIFRIGQSNDALTSTSTQLLIDSVNNNFGAGAQALSQNTEGNDNTAIGYRSLIDNTTGFGNNAFGSDTLGDNTEGYGNNAFGYAALRSNTTGFYNLAIGESALVSNTVGFGNAAIGFQSLWNNEGSQNIGIGYASGKALDFGTSTTFLGAFADSSSATLSTSTALGAGSIVGCSNCLTLGGTGQNYTRVGIGTSTPAWSLQVASATTPYLALTNMSGDVDAKHWLLSNSGDGIFRIGQATDALTSTSTKLLIDSGNNNFFVGTQVGTTSGTDNIAIGTEALYENTTGRDNTALGEASLRLNTTGIGNTAIGGGALYGNSAGDHNIAIGTNSLGSNELGDENIAIGTNSLYNNVVGRYNTVLGRAAGVSITGNSNTSIGFQSGYNLTTGSGSIALGENTYFASTTANQQLNIGNIFFGSLPATSTSFQLPTTGSIGIGSTSPSSLLAIHANNGDTRTNLFVIGSTSGSGATTTLLVVTNAGSVGIGTTTPTAQLSTTGTVRFSNFGAGTLTTDANGNVSVSSDERLKNIESEFSRGLDAILGITPISYKWKQETGFDTANVYTGFSAQNIQEFIPEAIGEDRRGFLTLSDRPLLATLINAVKELAGKMEAFAESITTEEVRTEKLCVGNTCVTEAEFIELVGAQNGGGSGEEGSGDTPPPAPPPPPPPTPEDPAPEGGGDETGGDVPADTSAPEAPPSAEPELPPEETAAPAPDTPPTPDTQTP